jgi:hypothetical protein
LLDDALMTMILWPLIWVIEYRMVLISSVTLALYSSPLRTHESHNLRVPDLVLVWENTFDQKDWRKQRSEKQGNEEPRSSRKKEGARKDKASSRRQ